MASFSEEFELSGGREMVSEERAHELLEPLSHIASTHKIKLSNKSFGAAAASVLASRIKKLSDIKVADISDIIAGRHEDEALSVLDIICNALSTFDLNEVNVSENALGQKGVIACRPIIVGKNLEVCTDTYMN
jgi:Ran GTPase-activating protein 1